MFNNKRFKNEVSEAHPLLSRLSQRKNMLKYFAATLAISTVTYVVLTSLVTALALSALPIIAFQVINFHHYIVDSLIWKVRKPQMRADLGLTRAA
jgi:hypothetical protein